MTNNHYHRYRLQEHVTRLQGENYRGEITGRERHITGRMSIENTAKQIVTKGSVTSLSNRAKCPNENDMVHTWLQYQQEKIVK